MTLWPACNISCILQHTLFIQEHFSDIWKYMKLALSFTFFMGYLMKTITRHNHYHRFKKYCAEYVLPNFPEDRVFQGDCNFLVYALIRMLMPVHQNKFAD